MNIPDTKTDCVAICTELRNAGFDEHGVLSTIPEPLLLDMLGYYVQDDASYTKFLVRIVRLHRHLIDHGYLEKVDHGYRLTGEDLR